MTKTHYQKLAALAGLLITLFLVFELTGLRENFSLEFIRATIEANLIIGSLIFIAMFAIGNMIQIPGWIFLAAAVLTLGKVAGGSITYLAAIASCLFTYLIVGFIGQDTLRNIDKPLAKKFFNQLDQRPVFSIAMLRLMFQTVPVLNYTLAMSGVKFRHYCLGTLIGLPLPIFIYCVLFDFLAEQLFKIAV